MIELRNEIWEYVSTATSLNDLANLYEDQGRHAEA